VVYTDLLEKTERDPSMSTYGTNITCLTSGITCIVHTVTCCRYIVFVAVTIVFIEELRNLAHNVNTILSANVSMADFMRDDWQNFNSVICAKNRSRLTIHGYAMIAT